VKQQARNATRSHYRGDWQALRRKIMKQWLTTHGPICAGVPELAHAPHHSTDLTVDHITARTGTDGYRVICRSINSSKGAHERRT